LPLERKFPTIRDVVEELKLHSTILDGEIVALDEEGIPRFQLLQKWQKLQSLRSCIIASECALVFWNSVDK
jgi:ATP-dependent DNA ligase